MVNKAAIQFLRTLTIIHYIKNKDNYIILYQIILEITI